MPVQVRAPTGQIVQFPDGTPDAVIHQAMSNHFGNPAMPMAQAKAAEHAGLIGSVLNGMTYGYSDELGGKLAKVSTMIDNAGRRLVGQPLPYTSDQAEQATVAAERAEQAKYAAAHPGWNVAGQIGGALMAPGGFEGAGFIGRGGNLASTAARSALVGGAMGAAAGAGNATGGVAQRVAPALQGGVTGAVTGAVAPALVAGGQKAWNGAVGVANNVGRATGVANPAKTAAQHLAEAIHADGGLTPGSAGVSARTIADQTGENTRGVLRNAGSVGPARQTLQQYRDSVAANLQDNHTAVAMRLTPNDQRSALALGNDLTAARTAADDVNYPQFQANRVPMSPQIQAALQGKTGNDALAYALKIADARRDPVALTDLEQMAAGNAQDVGAGTLDLTRRGLRDSATAAFQSGQGSIGSGLQSRAKDLAAALAEVPGFQEAVGTHADLSAQLAAIDHGATGPTAPTSTFAAGLGDMNDAAKAASGIGYRDALLEALIRPRDGATGTANRFAGSNQQGGNLTEQFGPDLASQFQDGLAAENQRMTNANWMAPAGGPQTFNRAQDAGHGGGGHGNPIALLGQAWDVLKNGPPISDAERQAMVDMGLSPAPDPYLVAALAPPQQAQAPGVINYALAQALAKSAQPNSPSP